MLNAGVDKVHRDVILGHSLRGMDIHYIEPVYRTGRGHFETGNEGLYRMAGRSG